jgi:hypothetical protein
MKKEIINSPENNDPLDELLREADGYLPDNGFTARVLTALPARRKHSWRRFAVLAAAVLVSGILAAWQLPAALALLAPLPQHWSAVQWQNLITLVPFLAALASLGWVVFAVVSEEE